MERNGLIVEWSCSFLSCSSFHSALEIKLFVDIVHSWLGWGEQNCIAWERQTDMQSSCLQYASRGDNEDKASSPLIIFCLMMQVSASLTFH